MGKDLFKNPRQGLDNLDRNAPPVPQLAHGRPVPATPTECLPRGTHERKSIVLQLLDLLTVFSLADLFNAVPDVLSWEN